MMSFTNFLLLCCIGKLIDVFASAGERRLVRELFISRQYDPLVRPVAHNTQRINVTLDLQLFQLIGIEEKLQSVEVSVWIRQAWTDTHLTWNPRDYDGIKSFITNPEKVWKPDIVLYNNIRDDIKFGGKLDQCLTRIQISHTGAMYWMCPVILRYTCKMEMKYFPFDTQTCSMKFGSWGHDMSLIDVRPISNELSLENYMLHNGWHLASTNVVRNELKYDCCVNKYVDVTYYLTLQRRSLFYVMNLALPIAIISGLTVTVFILPEESGERLALSTTLMLAVTVFMLLVAETTPATSDAYPLISVYFTTCMLVMFVMIVILCYVSGMYNKEPGDGEMGVWVRRYVLEQLSYISGIRQRSQNSDSSKITLATSTEQNIGLTNTAFFNVINQDSKDTNRRREDIFHELSRVTKTTNDKVDDIIRTLRRKDAEKLYKEEWRIVAKTIDRCLFVLFSVIFVVTTVGTFSITTYVT